ncbi:MAG: substrate-binding domain-containing protein [Pseudomonadota bacterium]|nr:substrate-binding domain-containing protein [Pseudomonadota bacterium]
MSRHALNPVNPALHVLCAGAVQGLVKALQPAFEAQTGATVQPRFGAVGTMKEALMAGAPCDVLIVTEAMLRALEGNGAIEAGSAAPIGRVRTCVAARAAEPLPEVDSAAALREALLDTPAFYVPDVLKSTAGQHIAAMLDQLEVRRALGTRLMVFANGASAMQALAERGVGGAIGCTQATEILYTPGLVSAGALPDPFGLATVYSAGVSTTATAVALAEAFIAMLCSADKAALRANGGFEPPDA